MRNAYRQERWIVAFFVAALGSAFNDELSESHAATTQTADLEGDLPQQFVSPPPSARPWAYAFWLEGNVTREGITADLEAMQRAGIGGLWFSDGDMGNPKGPHRFMSQSWRELFKHLIAEAHRLGLEISLNNGPGWSGSGGPWVTPAQAAQKVTVSETLVQGPARFDAALPQPPTAKDFYRNIVVLACPAPATETKGKFRRIENFNSTKSFAGERDFCAVVPWPRFIPTNPQWPAIPASQCITSAKVESITDRVDGNGHLKWDVPAGQWLILRIGHTPAGGTTRSSQPEATGMECDKLSRSVVASHFAAMVEKLLNDVGPLADKTLVSTLIESWEAGSGNWTDGFREEFRRRRGYDLLPYLPTLHGLVVDSVEQSERFLWDYRETVSELTLENYAGYMRDLAHQKGLRLTIEAYDGTCDDLRYAGRGDEPACEFWQRGCYAGLPLCDLVEEMASAAHVYGKPIVGAEAFTCWRGDFLDHPATLKPLGDWAFCAGVNRFAFSEWIMQPWPRRIPGVSFRSIGTVFHGSLTWWNQSKPWHQYVARCQHMLRQGQFAADVCFLAPEGAPGRFTAPIPLDQRGAVPDRPPYNFDGCPAELALDGMTVSDGRIVLPSGMKYRLLVLPTYYAEGKPVLRIEGNYVYTPSPLPKVQTMTPQLLRRIKELVETGATVLGSRPLASPSLVNYPRCDQELTRLADELWGKDDGVDGSGERRVGKGRVVWGTSPETVLAGMNVPPDFACDRHTKGKLNYTHRRTEEGLDLYFVANKVDGVVEGACEFRVTAGQPEFWWPETGRIEPVATYEQTPQTTRVPLRLEPHESVFVVFRAPQESVDPVIALTRSGQSLGESLASKKIVIRKATYSMSDDPTKYRDVTTKVQAIVDGGEQRFAAWRLGQGDDPGPSKLKTLEIDYTLGGVSRRLVVLDGQTACLDNTADPEPTARVQATQDGRFEVEVWKNGGYELKTASGRVRKCEVRDLPPAQTIDGAWEVVFPTGDGVSKSVSLDKLTSWSDHSNADIKYFSGTATYRKTFQAAADLLRPGRRVYLDLGRVAVIGRVKLNGKELTVLWKRPFRVEITPALRTGDNRLEVDVANLWVNRLIGDEQLPEDAEYKPDGLLNAWPKWLLDGQPSPKGRHTFATCRVWKKESPLQESGLLGPVKLSVTQGIVVE